MTKTIFMPNYEFVVDAFGNEMCIIYLCNGSIAIYDETANTKTLYHGYYDAQGSLIALTDNSGNVLARYAYDPWGKRVAAINWNYSPTYTPTLNIDRGYTMHEHLDEFGLINMNGRVYDPAVAQFLSPDPYIQDGANWLNYNRYAYCYNNPTRYTDPNGEFAVTAILLGMVTSAAIDYGMQVISNFVNGDRGKAAWINNVDFFDVAASGLIGGLTAGVGGTMVADYSRYIELGGLLLNSAIDYKANKWHIASMNEFVNGAIKGMVSQVAVDGIVWGISDCVESFRMKRNSSLSNPARVREMDFTSSLSLQQDVAPYMIGEIINSNDFKIDWRLEGNRIQSYLVDGFRVYFHSQTKEVVRTIPVPTRHYEEAFEAFFREHYKSYNKIKGPVYN